MGTKTDGYENDCKRRAKVQDTTLKGKCEEFCLSVPNCTHFDFRDQSGSTNNCFLYDVTASAPQSVRFDYRRYCTMFGNRVSDKIRKGEEHIRDFRRNFRYSLKFQIFAEIRDFRSKSSKIISRSRRAARPLSPALRPWPWPWPWPKFNFRIYLVPNLIRNAGTTSVTTPLKSWLLASITSSTF